MMKKILTVVLVSLVSLTLSGPALSSSSTNGKKLFNSFAKGKCKMCHNTSSAKKVGPGLAGVKNRIAKGAAHNGIKLTPAVIGRIIRDPKSVSPGAKMPANKKLTDREIKDIVKYLKTL